jgi:hypothetical protein
MQPPCHPGTAPRARALAADLGLKMGKTARARDGFRYKAVGRQLLMVGESPRGVYHGAFDFLESLGCGGYTPGAIGEIIPKRPAIAVPNSLVVLSWLPPVSTIVPSGEKATDQT